MSTDSTLLPHPFVRPLREGGVSLISSRGLAAALQGEDPPELLDVRPSTERPLARLPGSLHIPLPELPKRSGEVPKNRTVVVYCQFGNEARRGAEFLSQNGWTRVAALEGGIDEYSRIVDPTVPRYPAGARDRGLVFQQFPRLNSGCLAYLVGDPVNRQAVIIDPGREIDPYLEDLGQLGWRLVAIVETHTHADHLAGHSALHLRTDAPIFVSKRSPASYPHRELEEGSTLGFGSEELTVLETPGHTRDHLTLGVRDKIFTGDTLLLGSCGRTDLGDGSPDLLWESLHDKILKFPDETEVFPAHFGPRHALPDRYSSSVGFERATNEALTQGSREAFLRYMTEGWPPKPVDFDRIVRENLES